MAEATIELPPPFQVPEVFRDIDFTVSAEENTNKLLDELTAIDPRPSDEEIAHAVLAQQTIYEMLAAAGAVTRASCSPGPARAKPAPSSPR
ncbi:hypothetical protein [Streptomyces sp. NPDC006691]|uniref:hypothetical protein n=1 Tax=Streptomyces sp. NPDC006691 TaxID=3364757 RepID=UPI0036888397